MKASSPKLIRLLVVDDDEVDRQAVKRALTKGGITAAVAEAHDFASGKEALLEGDFDCVLLDFALPGGDGFGLLRAARDAELETPIIMLTGQGDETLAVDLMKSGAGDYVPKSALSPERLAQSIRKLVRVREAERGERLARRAVERQASQLRELAQLSVAVHASLSVDDALDLVARGAPAMFGAKVCSILLVPGQGGGQPFTRTWRAEDGANDTSILAGASEALLLDWQRSVCVTKAQMMESAPWGAIRDRSAGVLDGLIAAKLTDREGKSIGCILMAARVEGDFSPSDESVLAQLAQTTSVAIENTSLLRSAEEATRARDDVLAIVSHDLRNPLNAVSMGAQLLQSNLTTKPPDPARDVALIQRVLNGTRRMDRLIQDLLDATQIECRGFAVTPAKESAASLVADALESVITIAEGRGIRLSRGALDTKLFVLADRERILQVFSNLLGNALKFTKRGSTIEVRLSRVGNSACFEVADNGPGIEPDHLGRLFERYWRAKKEASRDGAGLGLYIARGIVEAHGGSIRAESELGRGTTFRFILPLAA